MPSVLLFFDKTRSALCPSTHACIIIIALPPAAWKCMSREERQLVKCRYLFNVGEGFQRFAMQHQVKLNRLTDILLTRNGSAAAGGLPGAGGPALPTAPPS